jgi:hypothetical protein
MRLNHITAAAQAAVVDITTTVAAAVTITMQHLRDMLKVAQVAIYLGRVKTHLNG